jgi:hypothetical protein
LIAFGELDDKTTRAAPNILTVMDSYPLFNDALHNIDRMVSNIINNHECELGGTQKKGILVYFKNDAFLTRVGDIAWMHLLLM